ncbi:protocadherin gamma-B6-like [Empidonax traillii]|uniref:protocadherin gamma-B6-like n=1 Tax=Empidonax traillii TaxID=164674 RepID=UPI000FFDBE1F|nr:protocadherin gamma-B6-like [Empidonax traillii]
MAATPGRCLRGPGRDPRGRGPKAAAVLWRRLRVSLLAAAERRWSRSRRRRSVLPPQAARSPGQWRPERQRHGQQRREAARAAAAASEEVVAVDADAGRNAWLSYELVQASEPALFRVGLQSGEVRTARAVSERDAAKQRLVAVVKDHGQPALSATATLHVVLADSLQEALPELSDRDDVSQLTSDLNLILVVSLSVVSFLFLCTVFFAFFFKYRRSRGPPIFLTSDKELYSSLGSKAPYNYCSSTLPLPYSYEVCLASKPGQKDFTFLRPGTAALSAHLLACEPGPGTQSGKDPPSPGSSAQVSF